MQQHKRRYAMAPVVVFMMAGAGWSQTITPANLVRQILRAHVGAGSLPADLTIQGQITDRSSTRPLRIQIQGTDKARYEVGAGTQTVVSILNGRSAWTGSATSLKALPEHAALHTRG